MITIFIQRFVKGNLLPALLFGLLIAGSAQAGGLDIYLVRHAETISNVTHAHDAYSENNFSEKGQRQVERLTEQLRQHTFDVVLVSPKQRTIKTILPYLQEKQQVAVIWPELAECCWQKNRSSWQRGHLSRDGRIVLEEAQKPNFTFRDSASTYKYKDDNYADGLEQMKYASRLLRENYFNSGKKILIVSHYHAGSRLMELLMGLEPEGRFKLRNATVSHLQQRDDGEFELIELSGRPAPGRIVEPDLPWM